jgi:hypothetical protein
MGARSDAARQRFIGDIEAELASPRQPMAVSRFVDARMGRPNRREGSITIERAFEPSSRVMGKRRLARRWVPGERGPIHLS